MSEASQQNLSHPSRPSLQVSTYDRVSSLLIALLVLVGFTVLVLFLVWLTQRALAGPRVVPIELLDPGGAEGNLGAERGFEEPDIEEVDDLIEPDFEDTLDTITDAVSTQLARLEQLEYAAAGAGASGILDRGPGGEGDADVIPRWERWEIRYASASKEAYADQLDYFRIELAATGGRRSRIEYASGLSAAKPRRRSGTAEKEERLYMLWRSGSLQRADRELLSAAGINVRGRILVQFYPSDVEQILARLEQEAAGKRSVTEIRQTVFGVREGGKKYEYYVLEQTFRGV